MRPTARANAISLTSLRPLPPSPRPSTTSPTTPSRPTPSPSSTTANSALATRARSRRRNGAGGSGRETQGSMHGRGTCLRVRRAAPTALHPLLTSAPRSCFRRPAALSPRPSVSPKQYPRLRRQAPHDPSLPQCPPYPVSARQTPASSPSAHPHPLCRPSPQSMSPPLALRQQQPRRPRPASSAPSRRRSARGPSPRSARDRRP